MHKKVMFYSIFTILVVLLLMAFLMDWISGVALMIGILALLLLNILFGSLKNIRWGMIKNEKSSHNITYRGAYRFSGNTG